MWDELWLYFYKYLEGRWWVKKGKYFSTPDILWQSFNGWSMDAGAFEGLNAFLITGA